MDCRKALGLLSAHVDGELPPDERAALDAHLRDCAACGAEIAALQSLRTAVAARATRHRAPQELADRIDDALADASSPPRAPRSSRFWQGWGMGAATATLAALVVGIGLFMAQPSPDERVASEVAANHVRSLLGSRAVEVASSDMHTVKPWFSGKLDYTVPVLDFAAEGFALTGGRLDYLGGRTVAALVYGHRLHTINVFALPAKDGAGAGTPRTFTRQGFAIERWTQNGMDFWAVSDVEPAALAQLASLYRAHAESR